MNWINSLNSHDARNTQSFHPNTTPRFAEDGRGPIEGHDFFANISLQDNFHQANCISLDRLLWYRAPRSWRISGTADVIVVIWVFALRLVFVVFATFRVAYIRQIVTTKVFGRDVDIIRFGSARNLSTSDWLIRAVQGLDMEKHFTRMVSGMLWKTNLRRILICLLHISTSAWSTCTYITLIYPFPNSIAKTVSSSIVNINYRYMMIPILRTMSAIGSPKKVRAKFHVFTYLAKKKLNRINSPWTLLDFWTW